jgi:hypothetical protein
LGSKGTNLALFVAWSINEFAGSAGERKVCTFEKVSYNFLVSAYWAKIVRIKSRISLGSKTPSTNFKTPFCICYKSRRSSTNDCTNISCPSIIYNVFMISGVIYLLISFIFMMCLSRKSTVSRGVRISWFIVAV